VSIRSSLKMKTRNYSDVRVRIVGLLVVGSVRSLWVSSLSRVGRRAICNLRFHPVCLGSFAEKL